ncbi:MAG: rhodanese-like domain-containing protein [Deltaproteobacteria bacterium]|nr:rhodanese-like domain-containing protein [Deltaproteobacteria bacterium]
MKNLFSILGGFFGDSAGDNAARIDAEGLRAIVEGSGQPFSLIDVRTPAEFREGHIPGAVSVPLASIEGAEGFPYRGSIVLYCAAGMRSAKARELLSSRGVKDVVDLKGGIKSWIKSNGRVVR